MKPENSIFLLSRKGEIKACNIKLSPQEERKNEVFLSEVHLKTGNKYSRPLKVFFYFSYYKNMCSV